jgi:hypothetical protein
LAVTSGKVNSSQKQFIPMKTKYLLLAIGAVLVATGFWYARAAWRAHRQLVHLRVRNVPLREVLRQIERQTHQKIRAEQTVDTRITLNVTDKPLAWVMERLSEQAGARWVTLYAVYNSSGALKNLDSSLRGEGKIETAGWTKIAPNLHELRPEPQGALSIPVTSGLDSNLPPGASVTATEDVVVKGPGNSPPGARGLGSMVRQHGPVRVKIVRGEPGGAVEEEVWTPEELLLESVLSSRLGSGHGDAATPEAATEIAQELKGRWTTFIAMRKARMAMGLGALSGSGPRLERARFDGRPGREQRGTNADISGLTPANLERDLPRPGYAEFGRLTPEQRVQRARERLRLTTSEKRIPE